MLFRMTSLVPALGPFNQNLRTRQKIFLTILYHPDIWTNSKLHLSSYLIICPILVSARSRKSSSGEKAKPLGMWRESNNVRTRPVTGSNERRRPRRFVSSTCREKRSLVHVKWLRFHVFTSLNEAWCVLMSLAHLVTDVTSSPFTAGVREKHSSVFRNLQTVQKAEGNPISSL